MIRIFLSLLLCGIVASSKYTGHKVYEVTSRNDSDTQFLSNLATLPGYDPLYASRRLDRSAQIMVAPRQQTAFESMLKERALSYHITVAEVARHLEELGIAKQSSRDRSDRISFDRYYRHADINAYVDELASKYSQYVSVQSVGKSFEERDMKAIRITNGDGTLNKKVIFVDAGFHAREWIAPATALYLIYQLVENRAENAQLLKKFDWLVLPVVNPDGYEYTYTNDRMWRKTRSKGLVCDGADPNRNFDFHWGEGGASSSECTFKFRGTRPFSEIEAQNVRDIMQSLKGTGKFYLTLHSFGNYLLYPWGWTSDFPSNRKDLDDVARAGAAAIRHATGSKYTYGSSTNVLYLAAGNSADYALGVTDFPISMTMELPGGGAGFDPKPSLIQGFASEAWIGIKAMAREVEKKYT